VAAYRERTKSMSTNLEIVSPEKLLLSRPVDMVVIPASEGDMGVLEGHTPMIIMLRGGTIDIYEGDRVTDRLFVDGGFAEVTPERCTVLANTAIPLAEINKVEAQRRLTEAEAAYEAADKSDPTVEDEALDAVQSARAMVEAAG
jgi:F-type H+-transporting ATPase subunit epsilon